MKSVSSSNRFVGSIDALVSAIYVCLATIPALSRAEVWSPEQVKLFVGGLGFASLFGVASVAMFMGWRSMWVLQYVAVLALVLLWVLVLSFGHGDLHW